MDELRFDGEVAVVTGGGRGLGRMYALLLAQRGARVVVNDVGLGTGGAGVAEAPADDVVVEIDKAGGEAVADGHSVIDGAGAIVGAAVDRWGRLDVLINNAGISGGGGIAEIPPEAYDRMIDTHYRGTVRMIQAAWPHLVGRGGGRIVNTSSSSVFGLGGSSSYISAKSAIIGLTRALSHEGRPVGVAVNAIMPTAYTRLTAQIPDEKFRGMLERRFAPELVAPFVVWLAHRDVPVNGEVFAVGGGRAARVLLAQVPGVALAEPTPEGYADPAAVARLMSLDDLRVLATTNEEVAYAVENLAAPAGNELGATSWLDDRA